MKAWKYFTSWFQDNEGCVEVVQYNVFLTWKTFGSRAEIGWSDCDFILLLGEEPPPGKSLLKYKGNLLLPPALVVKVLHYPLTWRTLIPSAVLAGSQALFVWSRLRLKRGYHLHGRGLGWLDATPCYCSRFGGWTIGRAVPRYQLPALSSPETCFSTGPALYSQMWVQL